jgi:DNA-binding response OmpR family regulator/KaiC/GvpD/RAD55 family RecA-like ATPase
LAFIPSEVDSIVSFVLLSLRIMAPDPENLISSGVEPVDKLKGGLMAGAVYLVQGTPSDGSLFAIRFLIEGLKRGETAALIMSYSPEDAVRRFALLGYDCLEDVYSGRLVILEYTEDTIQQIASLSEFTPVLRELEWLLGETKPRRIVFDPITTVLARKDLNLPARSRQFSEWAGSMGATFVLIAPSTEIEVVDQLRPLVADSFRFDSRESQGRMVHTLIFEKSPEIAEQKIELDPAHGVFLLASHPLKSDAPLIDIQVTVPETAASQPSPESVELPTIVELESVDEGPLVDHDFVLTEMPVPEEEATDVAAAQPDQVEVPPEPIVVESGSQVTIAMDEVKAAKDEFGEFLKDLMDTTSVLDLDFLDHPPTPLKAETVTKPPDRPSPATTEPPATASKQARAADAKIVAAEAARAVESLLRPPAVATALPTTGVSSQDRPAQAEPDASKFNILVVNDDRSSRDSIAHALSGYSLQFVKDGISALAKLISFKPDLVVLDVDLPIVDGFKVLEHIRSSLNMPVVVISGSRVRASDRLLSSELGADYFLTKPFSAKELAQKVRQLIARHRGISAWIVTSEASASSQSTADQPAAISEDSRFAPYDDFAREVEKRVEAAREGGPPLSVVGCRLPEMTSGGGKLAIRLFEIINGIARDSDLTTTNARNDLLILLPDANATGARAFAARMRTKVLENLKLEPTFWIRTFPESALAARAKGSAISQSEAQMLRRRASDMNPPNPGAGERRHSNAMRAAIS